MIKEKARQIQNMNRAQYMRILFMIVLLELIPDIFNVGDNILSRLLYLIISIAFLTVSHGYIVSSLKMVRNQSQTLKDDDAFVGFKRFKELFSTYVLMNIFMLGVLFIAIFILFVIIGMFISHALSQGIITEMFLAGNYGYILSYILEHSPQTLSMFLLCFFLMAIIQSAFAELLSFIPVLGSLIAAIITGIISIYSYLPRFHLAQAIFFEELAYHRYEQTNMNNGDEQYV